MLIPVVGGPYHGEFASLESPLPVYEYPPKELTEYLGFVESYQLVRGLDGYNYQYVGQRNLQVVLPEEDQP